MNRQQIIRMAREADREWDCDRDMIEWLEWFAALIASRVAAASASVEREACAKVCEARAEEEVGMAYEGIALDCAEAIRARGQQ